MLVGGGTQGHYLLGSIVSYCKILWRLQTTRLDAKLMYCSEIDRHLSSNAAFRFLSEWMTLNPYRVAYSFYKVFSRDQAALRTFISVCLSVCPSVRLSICPSVTPFWQCSCHHIILKFSGVITIDRHDVHAKGKGLRSKVKVTEVMTPYSCFWTIASVWIHIWRWYDAQSLMLLRRGTLLFFKVIHQISRSHG